MSFDSIFTEIPMPSEEEILYRKEDEVFVRAVGNSIIKYCKVTDDLDCTSPFKEIFMMKKFSHPNIMPILGFEFVSMSRMKKDKVKKVYYVAIEMPKGDCTLHEFIEKNPNIEEERLDKIAAGVYSGLLELHTDGIVHGDIKTTNVIMFGDIPKICDFGNAYPVKAGLSGSQYTEGYQSPELLTFAMATYFSKQFDYNERLSDCWAFGVLLLKLYSYFPPNPEEGEKDVYKKWLYVCFHLGMRNYPGTLEPVKRLFTPYCKRPTLEKFGEMFEPVRRYVHKDQNSSRLLKKIAHPENVAKMREFVKNTAKYYEEGKIELTEYHIEIAAAIEPFDEKNILVADLMVNDFANCTYLCCYSYPSNTHPFTTSELMQKLKVLYEEGFMPF